MSLMTTVVVCQLETTVFFFCEKIKRAKNARMMRASPTVHSSEKMNPLEKSERYR